MLSASGGFSATAATASAADAAAVPGADDDDDDDDDFGGFSGAAASKHVAASPDAAQVAAASPSAGGGGDGFGFGDDDDDDFGEFGAAPAAVPAAAAKSTGGSFGDEDEEDEDWGFASASSTAPPPPPQPAAVPEAPAVVPVVKRTPEQLLAEAEACADAWCQATRRRDLCSDVLSMLKASEADAADVVADGATDWDEWLQRDAGIPEKARELLSLGVSDMVVPAIPFLALGLPSEDIRSLFKGAGVKEVFFAALGKHMQLPAARADAAPMRAGDAGPGLSPAGSPSNANTGGAAAVNSMVDADWGMFENTSGPSQDVGPSDGSMGGFQGDFLSQTLSDFGLAAPPPAAFSSAAPWAASPLPAVPAPAGPGWPPASGGMPAGLDFFATTAPASSSAAAGGGAAGGVLSLSGTRTRGASDKVKRFLSNLPNLSHLYSSSVVTS
mmetsp:Transcript_164060/g.526087  ORF Transcript_164060/g.526087 Transcript_164060/m.526087 type:complete len:442 (+) Transcript_164060:1152-2477(+)